MLHHEQIDTKYIRCPGLGGLGAQDTLTAARACTYDIIRYFQKIFG